MLFVTPWTVARQGPPSMEVSRILEYVASSSSKYSLGVSLFPLHLIPLSTRHSVLIFPRSVHSQSCPTLGDPMDCGMPGLPVHHQLLEFTQTHVHSVGDAIQPSHPLLSPSPALNLPSIRVFQISQLFTSGGQNIGVSASASLLPMNIQD